MSLHQLLFTFCLFLSWTLNVNGIYMNGRYSDRTRIPCEDPGTLANGFSVAKRRNMLLQHFCNYGFKLIGDRRNQCSRGKWIGDRPVCAKSGCLAPSKNPDNGRIQYIDQYHIGVYCTEGYELAGNRYAYCNGTHWDRPLGYCRERDERASHDCDFETDDNCGWVTDTSEGFKWKRTMAANVFTSFRTGPRHDHTTMQASGGHYMLMESYGATLVPAALTSPIYARDLSLKTACCFQFYYFMYGAGVGNLSVYVKPVTKMLSEIIDDKENYVKFSKSGNQNNIWNEAHFSIEEMEDDFQIVFVADGAKNHLSDIAIDDVKIMSGSECKALDNHDDDADDSAEYEPTTTEQALYDTSSCVSRCGREGNSGIMRNSTHLIGLCSCHDSCIAADNCCPDYIKVCLDAPDSTTVQPETAPTVITSQENKIKTVATSKKFVITTPSTRTTTIMTTTTTTTTRMPTTSSTTTPKPTTTTQATTTTTRKPTTATTTNTTTTTTRKPTITTPTSTSTTRRTTNTTTTTTPKPTRPTARVVKPTTTPATRATTITTTTTTVKRSKATTPATTTTAATKIPPIQTTSIPRTHTISTSTLGAITINGKTFTGDTVDVPKTKTSQAPTHIVKKTWEWQPKPESNPRGSLALLFIFGVLLLAIIVAVLVRQKETLKAIWLQKFVQKNPTESGAEDTNSIIANFATEDATNATGSNVAATKSTAGNRLKLTLPSLKRNKSEKRGSSGEQSLLGESESDDIPLL